MSQPQPKLPSESIKFLGKTYNAWHIAIPLLESHVVLFPHVSGILLPLATCVHLSHIPGLAVLHGSACMLRGVWYVLLGVFTRCMGSSHADGVFMCCMGASCAAWGLVCAAWSFHMLHGGACMLHGGACMLHWLSTCCTGV